MALAALIGAATPAHAVDRNETMALMMAVATFNEKNCPGIQPNRQFIADTFNEFGVKTENMARQPYLGTIISTLNAFESNKPYFCESN